MTQMSPLVSTEWLAQNIWRPDVVIADASWYLPQAGRKAREEYEGGHIPGAVFFDIDAISDQKTDLPHMLPDPVAFASSVRKLGIGDSDLVIFYDGAGIYSAPRALWMMRAMGHNKTAVLDGGLPKWRKEGRAIETTTETTVGRSHFAPRLQPEMIRDFDAMRSNLESRAAQIVDARSPARFNAQEPEPRPGVRGGHMPGALNVHYRKLIADNGTLKPPEELRAAFAAADLNQPIVTSCGSGLTAAILLLALDEIGARNVALYDGSWTEWGARAEAPVVTS